MARRPYEPRYDPRTAPRSVEELLAQRDALARQVSELRAQVSELQRSGGARDPAVHQLLEARQAEIERLGEDLRAIAAERDTLAASLRRREEQPATELDQVKRLTADIANLRRRRDQEITEGIRRARREILSEVLKIRDSMDRAVALSRGTADPFNEGAFRILQQIDAGLSRLGLTPVGAVGETFDPRLHEAVGMVETGGPGGAVVAVEEQGFAFDDGALLRPARVVVAR